MSQTAKKIDRKYTYQDYMSWPDDERWEIIDGIAYKSESSIGLRPGDKGAPSKYENDKCDKTVSESL